MRTRPAWFGEPCWRESNLWLDDVDWQFRRLTLPLMLPGRLRYPDRRCSYLTGRPDRELLPFGRSVGPVIDYGFFVVVTVAGFESAVTAAGFESVGAFESDGAAALTVAAGLVSEGAFESVGVEAFGFTATFTFLQTVLPFTLVHTFLVVNLVAADAEPAPRGRARARTVAVPRARRLMRFREFVMAKTITDLLAMALRRSSAGSQVGWQISEFS
jgi:hypothetical protein